MALTRIRGTRVTLAALEEPEAVTALVTVARALAESLRAQGKLLLFGNGGSAADAQHLSCELVGRFQNERAAIPAIALTVDTSILTAVANDYSFKQVFARQIEALGRPGDVALGISHSGETGETIELLAEASSRGATTIALTSFPRSPLAELADIVLLTATQATTFRPDALSSRHPQLVVLDLLYVAVAQRTHERSHAAFQRTAQAVHGHKSVKDAKKITPQEEA